MLEIPEHSGMHPRFLQQSAYTNSLNISLLVVLQDFLLIELNELISKFKKLFLSKETHTEYLQVLSYPFRLLPFFIMTLPRSL